MKLCATCKLRPRVDSTSRAQRCYCKECWTVRASKWNKRNRDKVRGNELQRKFGITFEEYSRMLLAQGGVCAICLGVNADGRGLSVDHNHETLQVRALLCGSCNRGIGLFKESVVNLQRAIEHLETYAT